MQHTVSIEIDRPIDENPDGVRTTFRMVTEDQSRRMDFFTAS